MHKPTAHPSATPPPSTPQPPMVEPLACSRSVVIPSVKWCAHATSCRGSATPKRWHSNLATISRVSATTFSLWPLAPLSLSRRFASGYRAYPCPACAGDASPFNPSGTGGRAASDSPSAGGPDGGELPPTTAAGLAPATARVTPSFGVAALATGACLPLSGRLLCPGRVVGTDSAPEVAPRHGGVQLCDAT